MNLTLAHKVPLTMDSPALFVGPFQLSYMDIIIYGMFGLMIFIAIAIWILTYKRGG